MERRQISLLIRVVLKDSAQRDLEERRGYDRPPGANDMFVEVDDAIVSRFGGGVETTLVSEGN